MKNRAMFVKILAKSLINRRTRIAAATIAVLLGASLVAALATITLDSRGKVGRELRAYGANIMLRARAGEMQVGSGGLAFGALTGSDYLLESDLQGLLADEIRGNLLGYVPFLYGVVEIDQQKAVLTGTTFDQVAKVSPWWRLAGRWPENQEDDAAIVGANVASKLRIGAGDVLAVRFGSREANFRVVGIVETGAAEDSQLLVNLGTAQKLLDKPGMVSLVQVSALTERQPLSATVAEVQRRLPSARATVLSQIADAESSVVDRVEFLMLVVSVLVLIASALTVASTTMAAVLERTKEIGLMKALGASETGIVSVFLAEAAAIGCVGGVLGFGLGTLIALVTGQSVFGAAVSINPLVLPLSLGVALGVSLLASALPVHQATRIDPAITLRGE